MRDIYKYAYMILVWLGNIQQMSPSSSSFMLRWHGFDHAVRQLCNQRTGEDYGSFKRSLLPPV